MTTESQSTDPWLEPVRRLMNRGIVHSESATAICNELDGRSLQLIVEGTSLQVVVMVNNGNIEVASAIAEAPDATISGFPFSLLRLTADDPEAVIRRGDVKISGNPVIADDFRALFHLTRPDWEEELSRYTGDVVAHEIGLRTRSLRGWGERAGRSFARSLGEYLSEERRLVVTETELEEFCGEVDQLAAAVDRAAATLALLRARRQAAADATGPTDPTDKPESAA